MLELVAAPDSFRLAHGFPSDCPVWKCEMVVGSNRRAGIEATVTPRFSCNLPVSLAFADECFRRCLRDDYTVQISTGTKSPSLV